MKKPYLQFWTRDWITDIGLRSCHPVARGFWIDMICFMAQGDPYGHLCISKPLDGSPKARARADAAVLTQAIAEAITPALAQATAQATAQAPTPATATAGAQALAQTHTADFTRYEMPQTGSLEPMLPTLLNADADVVMWAIAHLEAHGVFSRTPEGVIYSRRMVRDHKAHEAHIERGRQNQQKQAKQRQNGHPKPPQGNAPHHPPQTAPPPPNAPRVAQAPAQAPAQALAPAVAPAPARQRTPAPAQAPTPPISTSISNRGILSPPTPLSASGKRGAKPTRAPRTDPKSKAIEILREREARKTK